MYIWQTYIYVCVCVCVCVCMPSGLLAILQWPHGSSCSWPVKYGYTLLVPMNKRMLNKSSKEYYAHIYVGFEHSWCD